MRALLAFCLLYGSAWAQESFLNTPTKIEVGVYASAITLDSWATQRGVSLGGFIEVDPLARPFVYHGFAGQAAGAGLGFVAGVGPSYLFYRMKHRRLSRVWLHVFTAGESVNAIGMTWLVTHHH